MAILLVCLHYVISSQDRVAGETNLNLLLGVVGSEMLLVSDELGRVNLYVHFEIFLMSKIKIG